MRRSRANTETRDAKRLARLKRSLNQNSIEFLNIDVETALTLTRVAFSAGRSSEKRERNTRNARRAYDTILSFARRVEATPEPAQLLGDKLEELKRILQQLGETF